MGQRGPVPKRSTERRRRNKESETQTVKPPAPAAGKSKTTADGQVKRPAAARHWHPIAKAWYTSLAESGQSQFYEPSDWQAARYVAEVMSKQLKAKPSAQLFAAIWSAMTDLLTTEAARRRVRMEIERPPAGDETPAGVTALDEYRQRLGS
ncbi:MAG: hypothetical protein JWM47_4525 [Acidimicrobiales bacterium]|nr:hypothetical protein [Acidimicrobiales bacterium]